MLDFSGLIGLSETGAHVYLMDDRTKTKEEHLSQSIKNLNALKGSFVSVWNTLKYTFEYFIRNAYKNYNQEQDEKYNNDQLEDDWEYISESEWKIIELNKSEDERHIAVTDYFNAKSSVESTLADIDELLNNSGDQDENINNYDKRIKKIEAFIKKNLIIGKKNNSMSHLTALKDWMIRHNEEEVIKFHNATNKDKSKKKNKGITK